jgi:hypothetical protein
MEQQGRAIMARFEREGHSFVIRMWRENHDEDGEMVEWRGWIDHVQSGERRYFRDIPQINDFIQRCLDDNAKTDKVCEPL